METSIRIGDLWLRLKIGIQVHVKIITSWNYLLGNAIHVQFIFKVLIWSESLQMFCVLFLF
jgi:hypothetical protein